MSAVAGLPDSRTPVNVLMRGFGHEGENCAEKMARRAFAHERADGAPKHVATTRGAASHMRKLRRRRGFNVAADKAKLWIESLSLRF